MIDESSAVYKFSERLTLWLPGTLSVVFLVLASVSPVLFLLTGHAPAGSEMFSKLLLFVGLLGGAINGVLVQQSRRIRALESVLRATQPSSISLGVK